MHTLHILWVIYLVLLPIVVVIMAAYIIDHNAKLKAFFGDSFSFYIKAKNHDSIIDRVKAVEDKVLQKTNDDIRKTLGNRN
jgi:hypothetical protein